MQITQITPAANQPKKDASTALQGLGNDLDTFLTMLTTQLKKPRPYQPSRHTSDDSSTRAVCER